MLKPRLSKNIDEICYPYMYESSLKCDYEILTDELCRQVGGILSVMPPEFEEVIQELKTLQPMVYHLNGSIRGKCAVSESDLEWLRDCYVRHKHATKDCLSGFVLPRGATPVPQLNTASSNSKKAIRLMVRLHEQEQVDIPEVLHRFCNVLCNYFFILTIVVNAARGLKEVPFQSESYRLKG
jgi:cob(I)alamin adenosyltransferase